MLLALKTLKFLTPGILAFTFTILCAVSSTSVNAQGNLLITPKRVVFDGKSRSHTINLANIGNDSAHYAVSFLQMRMNDDGNFEEITTPDSGQLFADKYLRIFPRTVTLGPNEAQVVKIQVTPTAKLSAGEYRSHLYFRAIPDETPLGEKPVKEKTKLSVELKPVYGISIPVIIRAGENNTAVSLSDLKLETEANAPVLKLRFNRSGNMSVYGDLVVEHISPAGKITSAGVLKGISVYTPKRIRESKIKLINDGTIDYRSGRLRVSYTAATSGKTNKLASAEITLN